MNFALLLTFKLTLLWLYFDKSCKTTLFKKPGEVFQNTPTFISIGPPIMKQRPFKKMKNLCFLAAPFSKKKIAGIRNFEWIKYLGKRSSYLKNWGIGVNYCWSYWLSKLLLHFIEYHVDQLNSKHTKIVVNSVIQYFEGRSQKKCLLKVWSFLVRQPQNGAL